MWRNWTSCDSPIQKANLKEPIIWDDQITISFTLYWKGTRWESWANFKIMLRFGFGICLIPSLLQLLLPAQSARRSLRKPVLCEDTNELMLPISLCLFVPERIARPISPQPLTWSTTFARCTFSCWSTSVPSLTALGCSPWGLVSAKVWENVILGLNLISS